MLDIDVRTALRARLDAQHDPRDTLIRSELGLCLGTTRVDVAVINGHIIGYEIKSERDRLDRLAAQVDLYGKVLDAAVLVSADKHLRRAMDLLPAWWGVWRAEKKSDGPVTFDVLRAPRENPQTTPLAVAQLLWRDEALALLEERGHSTGLRSANRWRLWDALVEKLSADDLACEVRRYLRARREWPGG